LDGRPLIGSKGRRRGDELKQLEADLTLVGIGLHRGSGRDWWKIRYETGG